MSKALKLLKFKWVVILISILLVVIPFFWLKPGEMDLGGDGTRLYFYDPLNYLKHSGIYSFLPYGTGRVEVNNFDVPFLVSLLILKSILGSGYLLISIFNVIKILVGFLSVYAIIKFILSKQIDYFSYWFAELSSVLGGIFYIFSPATTENYDKALPTHDQVFLYPLIFYLLIKYIDTYNVKFIWAALVISFIFSWNFSWVSAPAFFAFFPLTIIFIFIYFKFVVRKKIPIKRLFFAFIIFLGLHAFHLGPSIKALFSQGSTLNGRIFGTSEISDQLGYFYGVLSIPKVSLHWLAYSYTKGLKTWSILVPLTVILGLYLNSRKGKAILLTGILFLIAFFLYTAKISDLGVLFYSKLFYVPGFSMFRNFYGQWQFVYYFFFAILFGQALYVLLLKLNKKLSFIFLIAISFYLIIGSWSFIKGSGINTDLTQTNGVKSVVVMDPNYEETIKYLKSLPTDSKVISFPFTDYGYQVIHGVNNGAYVGLSTIGILTDKKGFSGYQNIAPFSDLFLEKAKNKDFESIKKIFSILNIRYILYDSNPSVYDETFKGYPYTYVRSYLPTSQKEYASFISNFDTRLLFQKGSYFLYELNSYLPHFYTPTELISYKEKINSNEYNKSESFFDLLKEKKPSEASFIEKKSCVKVFEKSKCEGNTVFSQTSPPSIVFQKISENKYKVKISDASGPFVLVFSEQFNNSWKIFTAPSKNEIDGENSSNIKEKPPLVAFIDKNMFETIAMSSIPDSVHFEANGFANAWYIVPDRSKYELIVEMADQRIANMLLIFSSIVFLGCLIWGVYIFMPIFI